MRKEIIFIVIIANFLIIDSCKRRKSSSTIKADYIVNDYVTKLIEMEEKIQNLEKNAPTLMISYTPDGNKTIFVQNLEELYELSTKSQFYDIKYYGLSSLAKIASDAQFGYIEFKNKQIHHTDIYNLSLQSFYLPKTEQHYCSDPNNSILYTFKVCSNFIECSRALDSMIAFAGAHPSYSLNDNSSWSSNFNNKMYEIISDISCIPEDNIFKHILNYKIRAIRAISNFYINSGITKPDNIGKTPQISHYAISQLKSEFDNLISYAKTSFKNPELISEKILTGIINTNPEFIKAAIKDSIKDLEINLLDEQIQNILNISKTKGVEFLDKEQQNLISTVQQSIIQSLYDLINEVLQYRIYLDRFNKQDPTEWLECIKDRTRDWYVQYYSNAQNLELINFDDIKTPNNNCIGILITPMLAANTLIKFGTKEIVLPFRQSWYSTLKYFVSQIPDAFRPYNPSINSDIYSFWINMFAHLIQSHENSLKSALQNISLADGTHFDESLITKEWIIAKNIANFHSWKYQFNKIFLKMAQNTKDITELIYILNYDKHFTTPQEQQNFDDIKKALQESKSPLINKGFFTKEEKRNAYEKYQKLYYERLSPLMQIACLNYKFANSGKNKIYKFLDYQYKGFFQNKAWQCFAKVRDYFPSWLNDISFAHGGINETLNNVAPIFEPTTDGSYNMEKLCKFSSSSSNNQEDMYSLERHINSWITAQTVFDECEKVTVQIKFEVGSTIAMIGAGQIAGLAMRLVLVPSRVAIPTTINSIIAAQKATGIANSIIAQTVAKEIIKRAPAWTFRLILTAGIFTVSNRFLLSAMRLNDFYYFDTKGVLDFGRDFLVGSAVIGIIHIASPFIMRTSSRLVYFGIKDIPYINKSFAKNILALGISTAGETALFVSIDPLSTNLHKALSSQEELQQIQDSEILQDQRNPWFSSLFLVLAFRLVNTGYSDINKEFQFLDYKRQLNSLLRLSESRALTKPDLPELVDYYAILSTPDKILTSSSKIEDIKQNTQQLLKEFHPSNFENASLEIRKHLYSQYYQILRAYKLLSNPYFKTYYDSIYSQLKSTSSYHQNTNGKTYYEILGIPKDATDEEIIKAFTKLSQTMHPDKFINPQDKVMAEKEFRALSEAFTILNNPIQRKIYDEYLRAQSANIRDKAPITPEKYNENIKKQTQALYPQFFTL